MLAKQTINSILRRILKNNVAAVAVEYAFVIAFISIVSATGMSVLGTSLSSFFNTLGGGVANIACEMPQTASQKGKDKSNRCKDK